MRRTRVWAVLGVGLGIGCSEAPPGTPELAAPAIDETAVSEVDSGVGPPAEPLWPDPVDASRAGSTVALATFRGARVVLVADDDARAIWWIDPGRPEAITRALLRGRPSQLVVAEDGRVYVGLRDRHAVEVLEATGRTEDPLQVVASLETADDPVGLAVTPDDKTLLVTTGWGRQLAAFSLETRTRAFAVDLPREPRGIAVSEDGSTAFISHVVGSTVSVVPIGDRLDGAPAGQEGGASPGVATVSLAGGDLSISSAGCWSTVVEQKRASVQAFAIVRDGARLLLPHVLAHAGPKTPVGTYGGGGEAFPAHEFAVSSVDEATGAVELRANDGVFTADAKRRRSISCGVPQTARGPADACLLPRAAAMDPVRGSLLVTCLGTDSVIELDAGPVALTKAVRGQWRTPAGPVGIALDADARRGYVWSQFAREIAVIGLGDALVPAKKGAVVDAPPRTPASPLTTIKLPALSADVVLSDEVALGRKLFHATGDRRISSDGRVCASCHPDGRDDGLVWASPEGPMQTPMLAGRLAGTPPYGWTGGARVIQTHVTDTFARLGGRGLKGRDLDALVAYAVALPTPGDAPAPKDPRVARGHEIFASTDTMCSICHTEGGRQTDGSLHDVSSGRPMDTPSLRFVSGTAPYFHDGRYATLRDLLVGSSGAMGQTKHLSPQDLDALEAYLKTL